MPRAGDVQHLQHGRRHDRRGLPGTQADKALEALKAAGEQPVRLGEIVAGDEGVILW
ncbi:MAG: hypothetical protein ACLUNZ_12570 [Evtepia sp.]